jgi:glycosyltransferase involved in cell wall biosynthesis
VFCARAALERHVVAGFRSPHMAVTLNSIPPKFLEPRPERTTHALTVGCLARWTPDKGIDVLLEAWRLFVEGGGHGDLLIAGPGMDESNGELVDLVDRAGVTSSVQLLGRFREPREFHRRLDIYVSPSRTEGFPNVVAEAMATGLAVVATNVGGTAEVLGNTGLLVENEDARAIADHLRRLAEDEELRDAVGAASRVRCSEQFTVDACERAVRLAYMNAGADLSEVPPPPAEHHSAAAPGRGDK